MQRRIADHLQGGSVPDSEAVISALIREAQELSAEIDGMLGMVKGRRLNRAGPP
jgi:hypothetical protein